MNIGMLESHEQCAWLKDVDEDTFARFCRFAYTGDYAEAAPDIVLDWKTIGEEPNGLTPPIKEEPLMDEEIPIEPPIAEPEPVPVAVPNIPPAPVEPEYFQFTRHPVQSNADPFWAVPAIKKDKKSKKLPKKRSPMRMEEIERPQEMRSMELWESFATRKYSCVVPALLIPSRPNTEACEDYTPVFMCHSSLYVFGDKYDIEPLKQLALSKLHSCLCQFTIYKRRVADVTRLVRYAYQYTLESHDEPLRSLVAQYIAANVESLTGAPEFDDLLQEPGPHTKDLVCLMVGRLNRLK